MGAFEFDLTVAHVFERVFAVFVEMTTVSLAFGEAVRVRFQNLR